MSAPILDAEVVCPANLAMDIVDDLTNQEKADLEFNKWMDAGAAGIVTGNIRLFVNHKTKVAYCFVLVGKLSTAQCALFTKDLVYVKVTAPSTWAICLVIALLDIGKPIVLEDRDALIERVCANLPEGFVLVFNKERQMNQFMHSCTVMAPTYVGIFEFSNLSSVCDVLALTR